MKDRDVYAEKMFEGYADVVNVGDLCLMLGGISKKLAYKLLSDGAIKSIRVGREYKIPKLNVRKYLLQQDR
jgi:excisionase family DNA binding protein